MHDPMTVAHEIYLGPKKTKSGNYRSPLITIWHVDPETDGTDDSCGYSRVRLTKGDRDYIKKVAKDQYGQLYARKEALREEKSYAHICYNQDIYGAIYWLWRHFDRGKVLWQYGKPLSLKDLQYVYQLATNPVDNFQSYKNNNLQEFEEFALLIYKAYKSYKRPWYKHPKWHIQHWKIQFHPLQRLKRRYWDKCSVCGKRGFKGSAYSDWGGTKIWHEQCQSRQPSITPKP